MDDQKNELNGSLSSSSSSAWVEPISPVPSSDTKYLWELWVTIFYLTRLPPWNEWNNHKWLDYSVSKIYSKVKVRRVWEWRYSSTILEFGIRWRWVVTFTPRRLYSWENGPRYPFDRRLGGPQSRAGHCWRVKPLAPAFQTVARRYIDLAIPGPQEIHFLKEIKCLSWAAS
jgi:hypothetical protein